MQLSMLSNLLLVCMPMHVFSLYVGYTTIALVYWAEKNSATKSILNGWFHVPTNAIETSKSRPKCGQFLQTNIHGMKSPRWLRSKVRLWSLGYGADNINDSVCMIFSFKYHFHPLASLSLKQLRDLAYKMFLFNICCTTSGYCSKNKFTAAVDVQLALERYIMFQFKIG